MNYIVGHENIKEVTKFQTFQAQKILSALHTKD